MVDLETDNTVDASKTIKPAIKPRAKDHDLTNPVCQSLEHNIVDEARPSNSRRSCTWSSSIRIPSDRYCEERNSAKNSSPAQRRSQKVDCKWIRKESPSPRTCRLHGTVKGHVFRSSTCSRRFHLRPVRVHSARSWCAASWSRLATLSLTAKSLAKSDPEVSERIPSFLFIDHLNPKRVLVRKSGGPGRLARHPLLRFWSRRG